MGKDLAGTRDPAETAVKRRLCGDPVRDALRAVGREDVLPGQVHPGDFTIGERYRMVEAVLHEQAFPGGMERRVPDWRVQRRVCTLDEWRHGGRRRFEQEVSAAARSELEGVDYAEYDLSPLRCLIGECGRSLCARLSVADRTAYRLRLEAMKADLALLGRKAQRLALDGTAAEFTYRVDFYEHAFEARILTIGRLAFWFAKGA